MIFPLPTLKNKIKLIIYYFKFNLTNLFIYNNFSSLICYLSTTNAVYQFKYPFEEFYSSKVST